ncbi:MAG TPA: peptidoglycan-binding domain-containing protein [Longimicrobium sp.]
MQSLAWSTILLLVLLIPGFAFAVGVSAPAGYGRDVTPRNPLAALSATVIVAIAVHALLTTGLGWAAGWLKAPSLRVQWNEVVEAVQMPPPTDDATPEPEDGDTAAERVGLEARAHGLQIAGYVLASAVLGFGLGFLIGIPASRGLGSYLQEHPWAARIRTAESRKAAAINYAHVLADVGHAGQQLLYRGRVIYFSLRGEGSFAYVVLAATEQRLLDLTGNAPRPGPRRPIGGHPAKARRQEPPTPWWQFWVRPKSDDPGAVMVIAGTNIKDVVFQGSYAIRELDDVSDSAGQMADAIAAGDMVRAASIRARLAAPPGRVRKPQSRTFFGPVREAQWLLSAAGLYDGPIDGRVGSLTREALRSYQRYHGLRVDGIPGPVTLGRLRDEYGD